MTDTGRYRRGVHLVRRIWTRWRQPITVLFLLAAVGWGVWAVWSQWEPFLAAAGRVGAGRVALAGLATGAGVLAAGVSWWFWLGTLGARLPLGAALRLCLLTQTSKYLPGGLWPFLAQTAAGRAHGVSPAVFPGASALWVGCHIATGAALGGAALMSGGRAGWGALLLLGGLAGVVLLGSPALLRTVSGGRLRLAPGAAATAWAGHGFLMLTWLFYGAGLTLLVDGLGHPELSVLQGTAAFAAAWVAGFLVIPAPAGVGVREAVLVLLLDLPTAEALAAALVSRILTVVADLGLAALLGLLIRGPAAPPAPEPTG